jgi:hypothetical protein
MLLLLLLLLLLLSGSSPAVVVICVLSFCSSAEQSGWRRGFALQLWHSWLCTDVPLLSPAVHVVRALWIDVLHTA